MLTITTSTLYDFELLFVFGIILPIVITLLIFIWLSILLLYMCLQKPLRSIQIASRINFFFIYLLSVLEYYLNRVNPPPPQWWLLLKFYTKHDLRPVQQFHLSIFSEPSEFVILIDMMFESLNKFLWLWIFSIYFTVCIWRFSCRSSSLWIYSTMLQ